MDPKTPEWILYINKRIERNRKGIETLLREAPKVLRARYNERVRRFGLPIAGDAQGAMKERP